MPRSAGPHRDGRRSIDAGGSIAAAVDGAEEEEAVACELTTKSPSPDKSLVSTYLTFRISDFRILAIVA